MFMFRQKNKQTDAVTTTTTAAAVSTNMPVKNTMDDQVVVVVPMKRVATFETMDTKGTCETRKMSNYSEPHKQLTTCKQNTHTRKSSGLYHSPLRKQQQQQQRNIRKNYSQTNKRPSRARFAAVAAYQRKLLEEEEEETEDDDAVSLWTTLLHHFRCGTACGFLVPSSQDDDDHDPQNSPSMDDDMYLWSTDQRGMSDLSDGDDDLYLSDDHSTPTQSPTHSPTHSKSSLQP